MNDAIKLASTKSMSLSDWREFRNKGLGGSDIGAVLGISKFKQPLRLYMEKTGQWEAEDLSDNEAIYFGNILEPVVADEFARRNEGYKVRKCNYILQHKEHTFMLANIDRSLYHKEKGYGILEIKTSNARMESAWGEDSIPFDYILQIQHYFAVSGLNWGYVACLIGGNKYKQYYIERDQELIDILIEKESDFWLNHVLAGVPPLPNLEDDCREIFDKLFPVNLLSSNEIDLSGNETTLAINLIEEYNLQLKEIEQKKLICENTLKNMMQEHEKATFGFGTISWKYSKPSYIVKNDTLKERYPSIWEELKTEKKPSRIFRISRAK